MAKARKRSRLVLILVASAVIVVVAVGLASFPVSTWFEQRAELRESQAQRQELVDQIESINREIELRVGPDGVAKAAKCFGPYVAPGSEVYSVPGVEGCVAVP